MSLSRTDALRAFARALHCLSTRPLEGILAEDVRYASQWVFDELRGKAAVLSYLSGKLESIRRSGCRVWAEMAELSCHPGGPCLIVSQDSRDNTIATLLVEVRDGLVRRVDFCQVPSPAEARGSGEFPV